MPKGASPFVYFAVGAWSFLASGSDGFVRESLSCHHRWMRWGTMMRGMRGMRRATSAMSLVLGACGGQIAFDADGAGTHEEGAAVDEGRSGSPGAADLPTKDGPRPPFGGGGGSSGGPLPSSAPPALPPVGAWSIVGDAIVGSHGTMSPSLAIDPSGAPVVAFGTLDADPALHRVHVHRWRETEHAWDGYGGPIVPPAGINCRVTVAVDAEAAPIVATTMQGAPLVQRWNGAAWSTLEGAVAVAGSSVYTCPELAVAPLGKPLMAWTALLDANPFAVPTAISWNGTGWDPLGAMLAPSASMPPNVNVLVADHGGAPVAVVGYYDTYAVERHDGASWKTITGPLVPTLGHAFSGVGFALDAADVPHVVVLQRRKGTGGPLSANVRRWRGGVWEALPSLGYDRLHEVPTRVALAFDASGAPLVAMGVTPTPTSTGWSEIVVKRLEGTRWRQLGTVVNPYPTHALEHADFGFGTAANGTPFLAVSSRRTPTGSELDVYVERYDP